MPASFWGVGPGLFSGANLLLVSGSVNQWIISLKRYSLLLLARQLGWYTDGISRWWFQSFF